MKYLKIAMLCSVVNFLANNRDKKIIILLDTGRHFVSTKWKRDYDVTLVKL